MKNKIVFILIFLAILIVCVSIILWKYFVLDMMSKKYIESIKSPNFYFSLDDGSSKIDFWKKDNVLKEIIKPCFGSDSLTFWFDAINNSGITLYNSTKKYSLNVNGMVYTPPKSNIYSDNKIFMLAVNPFCFITVKNYNNIPCYHIKFKNAEEFVAKDSGVVLYSKFNDKISKVFFSLNSVTDFDVEKPNLSNYKNVWD